MLLVTGLDQPRLGLSFSFFSLVSTLSIIFPHGDLKMNNNSIQ